ncbi:MAG: hypothetical protein ACRD3N_16475 [Terracidiphilus sp.]
MNALHRSRHCNSPMLRVVLAGAMLFAVTLHTTTCTVVPLET